MEFKVLPEWAESFVPDANYMHKHAALATKDGRITGNAVIYEITKSKYTFEPLAKVVTDAGNILKLNEKELEEMFHPPEFIMRDLLSTHKEGIQHEEDETGYWSGVGGISFYVSQNYKDIFEIEVFDYWGCVGGASETVGIDYLLTDMLNLRHELSEGVTYIIHDLQVKWYRGDGWNTDDDVEYYFETISGHIHPLKLVKQKLSNWWWRSIGWRLKRKSK